MLPMPPYLRARVLRLERYASTVADLEPAERRFNAVVIYDPEQGPPPLPPDWPEGRVRILIPSNGRDRRRASVLPTGDEAEAEPLQPQPQAAEEQPTWQRAVFSDCPPPCARTAASAARVWDTFDPPRTTRRRAA